MDLDYLEQNAVESGRLGEVSFDVSYLSGFDVDCHVVDEEDFTSYAVSFDGEVRGSVYVHYKNDSVLVTNDEGNYGEVVPDVEGKLDKHLIRTVVNDVMIHKLEAALFRYFDGPEITEANFEFDDSGFEEFGILDRSIRLNEDADYENEVTVVEDPGGVKFQGENSFQWMAGAVDTSEFR